MCGTVAGDHRHIIERDFFTLTFSRPASAGVVNQDAPHCLGRNRKKMGAILPVNGALVDQFEISLVNQGGGFQCLLMVLTMKILVRHSSQFAVDDRQQLAEGLLIPVTPLMKQLSHIVFFDCHFAKLSGANEYPACRKRSQHCTWDLFRLTRDIGRLTKWSPNSTHAVPF